MSTSIREKFSSQAAHDLLATHRICVHGKNQVAVRVFEIDPSSFKSTAR